MLAVLSIGAPRPQQQQQQQQQQDAPTSLKAQGQQQETGFDPSGVPSLEGSVQPSDIGKGDASNRLAAYLATDKAGSYDWVLCDVDKLPSSEELSKAHTFFSRGEDERVKALGMWGTKKGPVNILAFGTSFMPMMWSVLVDAAEFVGDNQVVHDHVSVWNHCGVDKAHEEQMSGLEVRKFSSNSTLVTITNHADYQKFDKESVKRLDELLEEYGPFTHAIYDKPHDEQWWADYCTSFGGKYNEADPSDIDYLHNAANCSMRDDWCRNWDPLYQVITKHVPEGKMVFDARERVYDEADLHPWPAVGKQAANATVWNGPHLCRAACKTGSKQDPAHCSLAAGSAYAFDILKELDLV